MAEIQVERKPRSHAGLILGLLLLVAVLGAGWYFTMGPGADTAMGEGDAPDVQLGPAPAAVPPAQPPMGLESTPAPGTPPGPAAAPEGP